jgi:hypothetical protein
MPKLLTLEDGSVRWDYDMPDEQTEIPARKSAKKKAAAVSAETEES